MTCKECIHYEACEWFGHIYVEEMADDCLRFKPKSRFIELPCEVGQTVYQTDGVNIYENEVCEISLSKRAIIYYTENAVAFDETAIGKTVFLSEKEAKKALEERNKK